MNLSSNKLKLLSNQIIQQKTFRTNKLKNKIFNFYFKLYLDKRKKIKY